MDAMNKAASKHIQRHRKTLFGSKANMIILRKYNFKIQQSKLILNCESRKAKKTYVFQKITLDKKNKLGIPKLGNSKAKRTNQSSLILDNVEANRAESFGIFF